MRRATAAPPCVTRPGGRPRTCTVVTRAIPTLLLVLVAGVAAVSGPGLESAHAVGGTEVTTFGTNSGALKMFRYVPLGLPAGAPMVVAMHGCTQSAAAYDDEPGWVALADRWKFAVVLPEQQTSNNSSRCFNWFQGSDIGRGLGEALSIKQMVDQTKADLNSNPARTFVTGLSAGGAMTSVMLASYPDVFAGGAIMAGVAGYPHSIYRDAADRNAVHLYSITGMNHGTPVDPGTGPTQCGTAAPYILDVNICSSSYIAKSWGLDTPAPA